MKKFYLLLACLVLAILYLSLSSITQPGSVSDSDWHPNSITVHNSEVVAIFATVYFTDTTFTTALGAEETIIDLEDGQQVELTNNTENHQMHILVDGGYLTETDFSCKTDDDRQIIIQQITVDPGCLINLKNETNDLISFTVQILN
ncbi:hypothetical protein KKG65_03270 [Patescibacteria group bacterium]|nr:hypothetical protein [Patescibacteria group bacterium]